MIYIYTSISILYIYMQHKKYETCCMPSVKYFHLNKHWHYDLEIWYINDDSVANIKA